MFLGIEIGGTKLQLGVGSGRSRDLVATEQCEIDAAQGAAAILAQIQDAAPRLLRKHPVRGVGFGFGGPVLPDSGRVIESHQVAGWDGFPLCQWCREHLGLPAVLGNDCDAAAFAEARFGAGQGSRTVFYVTVGTGIGGGLVIDGQLQGVGRPAVAEIGQLRPGPEAEASQCTVESFAAGPAIAAEACRRTVSVADGDQAWVDDLLGRCHGDLGRLTAKVVGEAACAGNELAQRVLTRAYRVLGWAIAQVETLVAPEVVVIGGGVPLIGEDHFFRPLREQVDRYVFPPLRGRFGVLPSELGQFVVVQGAVALAALHADKSRP